MFYETFDRTDYKHLDSHLKELKKTKLPEVNSKNLSLSVLLFPSDIIDCGPSLIKSKGIIFINSLHILFCWTDHFSWKS